MKIKKSLFALLVAVMISVPSIAFADGFAIYEWSAGGTAMGQAYMFAEDDPSLLAYNPAGITRLKGDWIGGGLSYINPRGDAVFHSAGGSTWQHNSEAPGYVPNFYYVHQQNNRLWWGIGLFTRFGNSTEYDGSTFLGRSNSYLAKISSLSLQPTIAYKLTDKISVAAGADIMYIALDLKSKPLDFSPYNIPTDCEIDGHNYSVGWNLGLNYQITPKTAVAALYRSKITHNMDADLKLNSNNYTGAHGSVTLPDSFTFGIGHKFNDKTRIEAGAIYTRWSTYDRLKMDFDKPIPVPGMPIPSFGYKTEWENVWRYQIGLEHKINDKWSFMCGYSYDNAPMPDKYMDFMVPTGDRQTALIGCKYRCKNSELAFAWGFMWIKDRVVPGVNYHDYGGGYADVKNNTAHILSLSYTVHLK